VNQGARTRRRLHHARHGSGAIYKKIPNRTGGGVDQQGGVLAARGHKPGKKNMASMRVETTLIIRHGKMDREATSHLRTAAYGHHDRPLIYGGRWQDTTNHSAWDGLP